VIQRRMIESRPYHAPGEIKAEFDQYDITEKATWTTEFITSQKKAWRSEKLAPK